MSEPNTITPQALFARVASAPGVSYLDARAGLERAPYSHLAWNPVRRLRVEADGSLRENGVQKVGVTVLDAVDQFLESESEARHTVIGAISYDLRRWLEPRLGGKPRADVPFVVLASYEHVYTYDHVRRRWLDPPPEFAPTPLGSVNVTRPRANLDRETYRELFARVQRWIAAGDIYQANVSIGFEAEIRGTVPTFYERLATRNPMPYGAYLDWGDFQVLSNSPELFLERRGRRISTRPIKGTRPRGASPEEDRQLAHELRTDEKECAEHVMIVDLERNDLGRIAEIGSVLVEEFETVESYATIHHLESTISAHCVRGLRFSQILTAVFPGGSITGAPKIRAMQILDEIEPEPRGFFTGSILHYAPSGDFTMSIAIRTATVSSGRIRYAAGGGLVADSRADREYEECFLKARAFLDAADER